MAKKRAKSNRARYTIIPSEVTYDHRYWEKYIDVVVSPAVHLGDKLDDFLYGKPNQDIVRLNVLYQDPNGRYTHIGLHTEKKAGSANFPRFPRLVLEIMLERLDKYLNEVDKSDIEQLREMRNMTSVYCEAYRRRPTSSPD